MMTNLVSPGTPPRDLSGSSDRRSVSGENGSVPSSISVRADDLQRGTVISGPTSLHQRDSS